MGVKVVRIVLIVSIALTVMALAFNIFCCVVMPRGAEAGTLIVAMQSGLSERCDSWFIDLYGYRSIINIVVLSVATVTQGIGLFFCFKLKKESFLSKEELAERKKESADNRKKQRILQLTAKLEELKKDDN